MSETIDATDTSRRKRTRRFRSPHPGVKLKPPQAGARMPYWRAVYDDPDKLDAEGQPREVYERLDPVALSTEKARVDWAKRKSRDLAKRRDELASGAPRATGLQWESTGSEGEPGYVLGAVDLFFQNAPELAESTVDAYRDSAELFCLWARANNIQPDTLVRSRLLEFRGWVFKQPKKVSKRGGKIGEMESSGKRSPSTVNGDLRRVRRILYWLFEADRLPKLGHRDFSKAFEEYREDDNPPTPMTPTQLRETFDATAKHDADDLAVWPHEHRRTKVKGSNRYPMISAMVAASVLSGLRLDELCLLDIKTHVFLDARDYNGTEIGEFRLRGRDTKTRKARNVSFEVSPLLRELVIALMRRAGGRGSLFGITYAEARKAVKRLRTKHKAPSIFTWQVCRETCSSYLTCAPGIYGGAAPYHSAQQLGHSVKVALKHYVGAIKGIPHEHRSVEAAMQIEAEVRAVIARVNGRSVDGNVVHLAPRKA